VTVWQRVWDSNEGRVGVLATRDLEACALSLPMHILECGQGTPMHETRSLAAPVPTADCNKQTRAGKQMQYRIECLMSVTPIYFI
jgi:hypothetical protein